MCDDLRAIVVATATESEFDAWIFDARGEVCVDPIEDGIVDPEDGADPRRSHARRAT